MTFLSLCAQLLEAERSQLHYVMRHLIPTGAVRSTHDVNKISTRPRPTIKKAQGPTRNTAAPRRGVPEHYGGAVFWNP
jgi:hypothetical protein